MKEKAMMQQGDIFQNDLGDPYAGTYFVKEIPQENDMSIWAVGCDGDSHVADFTGSNARKMAEEYCTWKNISQNAVNNAARYVCQNFFGMIDRLAKDVAEIHAKLD